MIVIQLGVAGDRPCGWAYQPRRDEEEPGKIIRGSVQATPNQAILYVANHVLEKIGVLKPAQCGVIVDGANVVIQASQLYLINRMIGRHDGRANPDLWDALLETNRKRSLEGFVIRWLHVPANENPMREPASIASKQCKPIALSPPESRVQKRDPWEADDEPQPSEPSKTDAE